MQNLNPNGIQGASREAYWALGNRGAPSALVVPQGATWLWLDPTITTPNVLVGVSGPGVPSTIMRPGDVLPIDGRGRTLRVWNVHAGVMAGAEVVASVGYLGFKCGTAAELTSLMAGNRSADPSPSASLLFAGTVVIAAGTVVVPTSNLRGMRLSVFPLNPAGDASIAAPADFAITIRPRSYVAGLQALTGWPAGANVEPVPLFGVEEVAPSLSFIQGDQGDQTLVGSQFQTAWDREVVVPTLVTSFAFAGLAGTGISATRVGLIVEGR